jgi:2-hydroxychromene-2-carboxylate isomerase
VLDAGRDAGLERDDVQGAIQDPEIKRSLRAATDGAFELGVFGVPTVAVGDELFWGDDRLEDAAAHTRSLPAR